MVVETRDNIVIRLLLFGLLLFGSWYAYEEYIDKENSQSFLKTVKTEIDTMIESPEFKNTIEELAGGISDLAEGLEERLKDFSQNEQQTVPSDVEKPDLETPTEQTFSIHNIEVGDSKEEVEEVLGTAKRSSFNEYDIEWHAYHENYQNFVMVAYDENNTAAALYTNQDLLSSTKNITFKSDKQAVRNQLGEPITKIRKGLTYYQFQENSDYDVFFIDHNYVTVFYDKHENNTVTAIQIISEALEQSKRSFYTDGSESLKIGFEYQLFDLTNAARVQHGLNILTWDEAVKETARKHSKDMAENNYFDHTNLEGQSPFDRMKEDNIRYIAAGENLAAGQFSSIFAHEGLMNSLGHRKNILHDDFEFLGVGVAFNENAQPYYTENFFAK
ncbi:serine protease [Bacillus taeanensis]|uniref:Serine protease n=1 Tax=Bacillus taeanensis TaxID=273032 RepID=A0A366Y167_9BACI|nr:serine protease [Bacillus taeanensis]